MLGLLAAGGNVYYLAKFAGILGLDVQDLGAAQTGMSKEAFKARLVAQNDQPETTVTRGRTHHGQDHRRARHLAHSRHRRRHRQGAAAGALLEAVLRRIRPGARWLAEDKPDVAVVFYNDHGLNFFLDKMPTFAVGAAPEYRNDDEGWGIPTLPPFKGIPELSWPIIDHLVEREFDIVTCQEMLVDHAFTLPLKLFWPHGDCPLTVPVCINTVQFPLPSAKRCLALGRAVGEAIASWDSDKKVVMIGSGGLSHQLDGERAGFINKPFDLKFMDSMVDEPEWATQYSILELVEKTGTQGVELLNWLAARGGRAGARCARSTATTTSRSATPRRG